MRDDLDFWVEESNDQVILPLKRKRNGRPKRLEFIGWGSKPLIEFLRSIGKDTSKKLSQYDMATVITDYVNAHNLSNPEKKKKIICDERLFSLFGKKVVPRIKIYDLLEPHFAENQDSSEDDFQYSSEEDGIQYGGEKKASNSERKPSGKKNKVPEIPMSSFAAVIPENIRLVYLKRTLVQALVKIPESFQDKLLGSFVRIKTDRHDFTQKHSHHLQQVIGVNMTSEAVNASTDGQLQLSNYFKQVPINELSDDNFTEDECEDLRERVKAGLLRRPTVVELETKARMLHEDITKHWIPREISLLQRRIDRANEKGWRRELYEYLEKKRLLEKPSEQERLLSEIPKVIADKLEPEVMPDALERVEEGNSSPELKHKHISDINGTDGSGPGLTGFSSTSVKSDSVNHGKENVYFPSGAAIPNGTDGSELVQIPSAHTKGDSFIQGKENVNFRNGESTKFIDGYPVAYDISNQVKETECQTAGLIQQGNTSTALVTGYKSSIKEEILNSENNKGAPAPLQPSQVIELSDDEVEVLDLKINQKQISFEDPKNKVWFYKDPQGKVQGPFPMTMLKRWSDSNYFYPGFMVWKKGQSQDEAVLLVDVLRRLFPYT
ncbi:hypothetical protein M9H77_03249 [Catharanthus roseus]|uniref:Uncharacterized protein n=1 Tax=Catharanthus roseus TaxID=4058 RepID=A0ACC0CAR9_CATRO|nr:hypothetical protein M9H77_03249 [Catharanthus roseus]